MTDTAEVREELIQVAAVAIAIVQDIDTGSAKVGLGDLDEVMHQVEWERKRQNAKFGAQHHTMPEWLMILGEEYGEACQAAVDAHGFGAVVGKENNEPKWVRDPECVKAWPECEDGMYDPRCCRFPKSCSPMIPAAVGEDNDE